MLSLCEQSRTVGELSQPWETVFREKEKKIMSIPNPEPQRYITEAELKIKEQERLRDLYPYQETASRLSKRASILIKLTIFLLIIIVIVIVLHL